MKKIGVLYGVVITAMAVMIVEIAGFGVLVPYFGSSLVVSSNLIGGILTLLAVGYYIGGMRGDVTASVRALRWLAGGAALWALLALPFYTAIAGYIGIHTASVSLGSFTAVIVLFAPLVIPLGVFVPYAVKVSTDTVENSGAESGVLYAGSSLGSIAGVLVAGFLLLPNIGVPKTLFVAACLMGSVVLVLAHEYRLRHRFVAMMLFVLVGAIINPFAVSFAGTFSKSDRFSDGKVTVLRSSMEKLGEAFGIQSHIQAFSAVDAATDRPVRVMTVNGEIHSGSYTDSNETLFEYAKFNRLGGHFNPQAKHALLIGGGSYSYVDFFLSDTPLYDVEKTWELNGVLYSNNKTITLPVVMSNSATMRAKQPLLIFHATSTPVGRQIEGLSNSITAENQKLSTVFVTKHAGIFDTGFAEANGYVHVHEVAPDGTPGAVISPDVPLVHAGNIIGHSALISGDNDNVEVPLDRAAREGEVLFPMLHRDNGNGHFDNILVDGYEQIESLDVVEIDPNTTKLAEEYFFLNRNDPRLQIFHEDGRTYLNRTKQNYDIIYLDAFRSFYSVPWQLATKEAAESIYALLNDNGVVVANLPTALSGAYGKFFQAELATYRSVFPEVRVYAVRSPHNEVDVQNIIIVAFKNADNIRTQKNIDPEINEHLSHEWKGVIDKSAPILTDDFSPTDYYINAFADLHSF